MKIGPTTVLAAVLFLPAEAEDPIEVGFSKLAGFDYVEGMKLPEEVTKLDEKSVTVSGFMQREDAGDGPTEFFMLINDACGCDGTPMLNEIVFCAMPEGEPTEIQPGVVSITGTLYVGEETDDDVVVSLYSLDVDSVDK